MIAKLITALQQANLDVTPEEVAEMLWLALHIEQAQREVTFTSEVQEPSAIPPLETTPLPGTKQPRQQKQASSLATTSEATSDIHLPSQHPADTSSSQRTGLPFKMPAAPALPGTLAIARALRPLRRRIPSRTAFILDEKATAERIAETQKKVWTPALNPAPMRWFDVVLVIDEGTSMMLWRQTISELRALLERQGAFRDVRVWRLVTDDKDHVQLYAGTHPVGEQQQARNPKELIDPSGRRLILVATDCVSPAWHSGKVQQVLDIWGQKNSVTLIQMLPRRLWLRTALRDTTMVQVQASIPGIANRGLKVCNSPQWFDESLPKEQSVPISVVTLERGSLVPWVRMVTGRGDTWASGVVFDETPLSAEDGWLPEDEHGLSPKERVQRFRAAASPPARKLAGLLAAAPISLPIIRLVQRTMLPESQQVHVAEVLLGGLLEEVNRDSKMNDPDYIEYDFLPGVRDELLNAVPLPNAFQVLREISEFIGKRTGYNRDFQAVITASTLTEGLPLHEESRPFAQITAKVWRRLGGEYAALAAHLEQQVKELDNRRTTPRPTEGVQQQAVDEQQIPTIGIITALPQEYAAMKVLLDHATEGMVLGGGDSRRYTIGEVPLIQGGKRIVVLALLPNMGTAAATSAARLLEHFPQVRDIIMVGIAGGVPNPSKPDEHVRLGDIVISNQYGVIQYNFVKKTREATIYRPYPHPPSANLLLAVRFLEAAYLKGGERPWKAFISQAMKQLYIRRPAQAMDVLTSTTERGKVIPHPKDTKRKAGEPRVFIGPIASANSSLKDAALRDDLRDRFGVKAIEMEATGVAYASWDVGVRYLVIRGICDYCDESKNDLWQEYASVVAAAYTRALLASIPKKENDLYFQHYRDSADMVLKHIAKHTTGLRKSTLWFIRDGESEADAGFPTLFPAVIELTHKGYEQAEQIAHMFDTPPSLLVTSSYTRTLQTAWATYNRFSDVPIEELPVHEFTYLSPDKHRNTTIQQRREEVEKYWQRCDPYYVDGEGKDPEVESFEKFMLRVHSTLEQLRSREEEFIAVFSHEQFIWAIFWLLLFKPTAMDTNVMKQFRYLLTTYPIPNGAILQVQFEQDKTWVRGIIPPHLMGTFEVEPPFSIYTLLYGGSYDIRT